MVGKPVPLSKHHVRKKVADLMFLDRSFRVASLYAANPSLDQQACASRMIDAWDEDHICSSCIQPSFFAHECNPHDSSVIAHVPHVRQTIASTPLLHYIQEAHKPHNNSLQASNPVSMNTSFFLQAEGHSADSTGDQSPTYTQICIK